MTDLGYPRLPDAGSLRRARLCLVGAVGHPPMIYAVGPDSDGDLRAVFALAMGLRIDQVRLKELDPGGIYEIGKLISDWVGEMPTLVSANPERWSDEKNQP